MTTLAADVARNFELGDINELPVIAADIIYEGAAVGENGSGYMRPLSAGDPFMGFAERKVDNSTGSAGDKKVRLLTKGLVQLSIGSLAITDINKPVYASDDATFTLTASTNSHIGRVVRYVSSGVGIVAFDANRGGLGGAIAELTDNSGGTADATLEDCNNAVTGVDGTGSNAASKADVDARLVSIANNIADLAAKLNAVLRQLGN